LRSSRFLYVQSHRAERHAYVIAWQAKIKDAETVNIWLGANVMLEYGLDEV
jgi:hypothetical protein